MIRGIRSLLRGAERLSLQLRLPGDLRVAIWERPGRWMTDAQFQRLTSDLGHVAKAGQGGKPVPAYGALSGDRVELGERVITLVSSRGEPIAFSALRYLDLNVLDTRERVVHLGLAYVHAQHRGRGLSALLYGLGNFLLFFRNGLRGFWVSNVTQVPSVFGLVAEHYDQAFPSWRAGVRQSFGHRVRARAIMREHRAAFGVGAEAVFDEATQIIQDAYTGGSDDLKKSFAEAPKHRLPAVNAFCRAHLDYQRGDDFLQLGCWNLKASVRFLRGLAPRGLAGRLLVNGVLLVLASLVVPMVRWLVNREDEND